MKKNIACIILAAGKGERMKSDTPKVLHQVCSRPMLSYVFDVVKALKSRNTVVVLGHKYREVKKIVPAGVASVVQKKILGTADAVKTALTVLKGFKGTVLVLYGDIPLIKSETLKKLLKFHHENSFDATLLTAHAKKPLGYGRILRDGCESICGIVEEKDANDFQKDIKEINTGIICFDKVKLQRALLQVRPNNRKKEYYLTDIVKIFYDAGFVMGGVKVDDMNEALGINSRVELALAQRVMQQRINEAFMKEGVTLIDPATAFISFGSKIGPDTVIYPFTAIENDVIIGSHCSVGPFLHLREGTRIADRVVVGNFLEIARSKLSQGTFVKHFGYLGDSCIGRRVNIGAGVVTANFDGKRKNFTNVLDDAFVGSDTVIVAPATIGKRAVTGAGSVVTKHTRVPDNAVVVGIPAKPLAIKKKKKGY